MATESPDARSRILLALGAAAVLVVVVVVVAVASGGGASERGALDAPPGCVTAWNNDRAARAYGRHNFNFHRYEGALVTYLTPSAEEVGPDEGGLCAVIFPSRALDPEPFAAGQVLRRGRWIPISSLPEVELDRVAELQVTAAGAPNTRLDGQGLLTPL
jgi:hypothetical protein